MQGTIEIDLNRLSYKDYRAFVEAGPAADELGLLCQVVRAWPFAGDPGQRASYEALGLADFMRVQTALQKAIRALGRAEGN
jgi:hypothetical protein